MHLTQMRFPALEYRGRHVPVNGMIENVELKLPP